MEGIQIALETTGAARDIQVVKISGYIDTTTSSELERVIQGLLREQKYKIVIDLQDVDYISSAGWGIFISEIKNIRTHRGDLKLACMSETVNEVYELLEFSTILTSAATINDAVALFGNDGAASAKASPAKPAAKAAPKPPPARPAVPTSPAAKPMGAGQQASSAVNTAKSSVSQLSSSVNAKMPPRPAPAPAAQTVAPAAQPASSAGTGIQPLIDRIKSLVKAHPDWGAWKLKGELNRRRGTQPKVSWGEVRAELKYNDLGSKKDRFKFARGL